MMLYADPVITNPQLIRSQYLKKTTDLLLKDGAKKA